MDAPKSLPPELSHGLLLHRMDECSVEARYPTGIVIKRKRVSPEYEFITNEQLVMGFADGTIRSAPAPSQTDT